MSDRIRILAVCQWPLGGIRTYLKYNYACFPPDEFEITLLASPANEKEAVQADMDEIGVNVVWTTPVRGRDFPGWRFRGQRRKQTYDLVHSQGFFSAFHVSLFNWLPHVPHMMTVHGIVEQKYLAGPLAGIKKQILQRALGNVDLAVAVSDDIGQDVRRDLPALTRPSLRWETIHNGIDTRQFAHTDPGAATRLKQTLGVSGSTFVFGFFGRFMPQKGLEYLIEAVDTICRNHPESDDFVVMLMGSGDRRQRYQSEIERRGLESRFRFLPFQPEIAPAIQGCDAVVMPSVWEAFGILAAETFACGVPLIASDCIGLREATVNTPAVVVPAEDSAALARAMRELMHQTGSRTAFQDFRNEALARFDVRRSARQLADLARQLCGRPMTGEFNQPAAEGQHVEVQ